MPAHLPLGGEGGDRGCQSPHDHRQPIASAMAGVSCALAPFSKSARSAKSANLGLATRVGHPWSLPLPMTVQPAHRGRLCAVEGLPWDTLARGGCGNTCVLAAARRGCPWCERVATSTRAMTLRASARLPDDVYKACLEDKRTNLRANRGYLK